MKKIVVIFFLTAIFASCSDTIEDTMFDKSVDKSVEKGAWDRTTWEKSTWK